MVCFRKFVSFAAILFLLIISNQISADEITTFLSENQKIANQYKALINSPESIKLIDEGKKSEVNSRLKALVPNNKKTVHDYFIISNMLYRADPESSYQYIKKANQLMPDNPYILMELGMHKHRTGDCTTALPLYEKVGNLFKNKIAPNLWGYIAHCRLVTGDYSGALEAWTKADFKNHHIDIEKSMYEIFSKYDPDIEREKLITNITNGSSAEVCELIELDNNWEIDWWNIKKHQKYLDHDINLIKNLAIDNHRINSAWTAYVNSLNLSNQEFREFLKKTGYWEPNYLLPEEPTSIYVIIRELKKREIATPVEILEHYENQLIEQKIKYPDSKRILDLLAYLYSATNNAEKLKKIDEYGWKTLKIQKYAESYIYNINKNSSEYKKTIEDAALDFPNSIKIQRTNLVLNSKTEKKLPSLAKFVAAQFANVSDHITGPDRLNNFMWSLESELQNQSMLKP